MVPLWDKIIGLKGAQFLILWLRLAMPPSSGTNQHLNLPVAGVQSSLLQLSEESVPAVPLKTSSS